MITIKATCPNCDMVELVEDDIKLMVCSQASRSYYQFCCPRCLELICKPADDHIISLLESGGVKANYWSFPAEALELHGGPPISYNDILEFALDMGRRDYLADFATQTHGVE